MPVKELWVVVSAIKNQADCLLKHILGQSSEDSIIRFFDTYDDAEKLLTKIGNGALYKINIELEDARGAIYMQAK